MFNPSDLTVTRTPKAPSFKDPGDIVIETRPVEGGAAASEGDLPVVGDAVSPLSNPMAALAGELESPRTEPADPDQALPAVAQRVLDLITRNSPALDSALSAIAGLPTPKDRPVTAMGGRLGRGAHGDDLRPERRGQVPRPTLPPQAAKPVCHPEELTPPLEFTPLEPATLAELPAPPALKLLELALQETLSTRWTAFEGNQLCHEAPMAVPLVQVHAALRHLDELEAFVGGEFRMVSESSFKGFHVSNRGGFSRSAGQGTARQAGPVGAYLVSLHEVYGAYKADYYGLVRARRALLDRRDPASLSPLLSEEELAEYLWRKYGEALKSRLWRLLRTSSRHEDDAKETLGSDRPWRSGGLESSFELVQAGTFVALQSEEGDLEVQKEQGNPWSAQGIFNLAVAIRLVQDVVAYDVRSGVLKINGRVVPWSNGVYELPEGARLELADDRLEVVSLRGDTLTVLISGRALVISGTVSGDRAVDSVAGALGRFGAGPSQTWTARDGQDVLVVVDLLNSWQVRSGESLF